MEEDRENQILRLAGETILIFSALLLIYSLYYLRSSIKKAYKEETISPREKLMAIHVVLFLCFILFLIGTEVSITIYRRSDECVTMVTSYRVFMTIACIN